MAAPFCIFGFDPGTCGAGGIYHPSIPDKIGVEDMPLAGRDVDGAALARIIRRYAPDLAVIEQVSSRPGQGVASTFRFGRAYGTLIGVITALEVPCLFVTPQKWKRHFNLSSDKEEARAMAIRLWPSSTHFERKKDHNRAEAALIARWGAANVIP
jgi:crossover junction endodeoxyribonuclease RuvC